MPLVPNRLAIASVEPGIVPHGVNLFEHRFEDAGLARLRWENTLQVVNSLPLPEANGRLVTATEAQANRLLWRLKTHPLLPQIEEFGPQGGCFIKAFLFHLEALHAGFHKESLGKLVKVWDANSNISHHFGMGLRREDLGWWALDEFNSKPKKLETYGYPGTFLTEPTRWGVTYQQAEQYTPTHFFKWAKESVPEGELPMPDHSKPLYKGMIFAIRDYFKSRPPSALDIPVPRKPRASTTERGVADQQTLEMIQREADAFESAGT